MYLQKNIMILIEKHIIKKSNVIFKELDQMCFLSKNLYNSVLYTIRQYYFNTKQYKNRYEIINEYTKNNQIDYRALPAKISQEIINQVDNNFKSFFNSLKSNKIKHKISIPKYLDKNARNILQFNKQTISIKELRNGYIKLSGLTFKIKTKTNLENIQAARVIHKGSHIIIEILFKKDVKQLKTDNNKYCAIDLGVNNLCTVTSNVIKPLIINGKPLKSINQYYNKQLSILKSQQITKNYNKNKIQQLSLKRNNKINDYIHKSSRYLVNHLVSNNISKLIIGYNKEWKQETNMSKQNNQNFVQIPYLKLINLIKYKCELEGIDVIIREESYTSKCSFLDNEQICKHNKYLGKRIKRGLFKTFKGLLINADINASLNILRKEVPNAFNNTNGIEVCSMPSVFTVKL